MSDQEAIPNARILALEASWRNAESQAWWRDQKALVDETDIPLAVLAPRADATPLVLQAIGTILTLWQADYPPARHIWGREDLLAGQAPRTPPLYLSVVVMLQDLAEASEPVALAYVASGTDIAAAFAELESRIAGLRSCLAWFESPKFYSLYQV